MLHFQLSPFPELSTTRLHLRQLRPSDVAAVFALYSHADVMRYIPLPIAQTLADAEFTINKINTRIANNESINWAITLQSDTNTVIGTIGYVRLSPENHRAEVGYMLHPKHHKQHIMDEALKKVLRYGFDTLQLHSIEAVINPLNIASEKLLQNNQFVKEAHFKEKELINGQFTDSVIYSLLRPK